MTPAAPTVTPLPAFVVQASRIKPAVTPLQIKEFNQLFTPDFSGGWVDTVGRLVTPERAPILPQETSSRFEVETGTMADFWPTEAGPLGVGRTGNGIRPAVLWDGIPAARPFDGKFRPEAMNALALSRAEWVSPGGGAGWPQGAEGVWQAISTGVRGRLQVLHTGAGSEADPIRYDWIVLRRSAWEVSADSWGSRSIQGIVDQPVGSSVIELGTGIFATSGYDPVAPAQRSKIDRPLGRRARSVSTRLRTGLGKRWQMVATARGMDLFVGDGTPGRQEKERDRSLSVQAVGTVGERLELSNSLYWQAGNASRTMTMANPDRSAETPQADVVSEPAAAWGWLSAGVWADRDGSRWIGAADFRRETGRFLEGTDYRAGSGYNRWLSGGGGQTASGLFLGRDQYWGSRLWLNAGIRAETWSGQAAGSAANPSLGTVWSAGPGLKLRACISAATQLPTLQQSLEPDYRENELILPARLAAERARDLQLGFEWTRGGRWSLVATSTVGQVAQLPARIPVAASPASGDSVEEIWVSHDRARREGVSVRVDYAISSALRLGTTWTVQREQFQLIDGFALAHKTPAGVPGETGKWEVTWTPNPAWSARLALRSQGSSYADDADTRRLHGTATVGLAGTWRPRAGCELFARVDNLGAAAVPVDISAAGIERRGSPRTVSFGLTVHSK